MRNFRACLRSFRYRRSCYFLCLPGFLYRSTGRRKCLRNALSCCLCRLRSLFLRYCGRVGSVQCSVFYRCPVFFLCLLVLYRFDRRRRPGRRRRRRLLLARTHY